MHATGRSVVAFILALMGAVVIGVASMITSAVTMAATTALIVPGTGYPDPDVVTNYKPNARDYYIAPFNPSCDSTCNLVGVPYIAEFAPLGLLFPGWGGLNGATWDVSVASGVSSLESKLAAVPEGENIVIFGYSQGAAVVSIEKGKLADAPNKDQMSMVLIGNIDRPSGGLFTRLGFFGHIPILDATTGEPTPTDTGIPTTDIAFEYDGVSDFPLYLTNGLAVLNALAGFNYIHGDYLNPTSREPGPLPYGYTPETLQAAMNDPANQQTFGDTTYITIPATSLPIVQPFLDLAAATGTTAFVTPIVDLVSPTLRVLIDLGYDRSINPGVPTPARLIPIINPVPLTVDLVAAAVEGVQAALGDLGATTMTAPTTSEPSGTTSPLAAARSADTTADAPKAATPVSKPVVERASTSTPASAGPEATTTTTSTTTEATTEAATGDNAAAPKADNPAAEPKADNAAGPKADNPAAEPKADTDGRKASADTASSDTTAAETTPSNPDTPSATKPEESKASSAAGSDSPEPNASAQSHKKAPKKPSAGKTSTHDSDSSTGGDSAKDAA